MTKASQQWLQQKEEDARIQRALKQRQDTLAAEKYVRDGGPQRERELSATAGRLAKERYRLLKLTLFNESHNEEYVAAMPLKANNTGYVNAEEYTTACRDEAMKFMATGLLNDNPLNPVYEKWCVIHSDVTDFAEPGVFAKTLEWLEQIMVDASPAAPEPTPVASTKVDPDAAIAELMEKNPYDRNSNPRQWESFDLASKRAAQQKIDRQQWREESNRETSDVFRGTVAEITEAVGLDFPSQCMRELMQHWEQSRLPWNRESLRRIFFRFYAKQLSAEQRAACMTEDEHSVYVLDTMDDSVSAEAFAKYVTGRSPRHMSGGAIIASRNVR